MDIIKYGPKDTDYPTNKIIAHFMLTYKLILDKIIFWSHVKL